MATTEIDTGTKDLLASLDEGVLTLTLNRPEARNALSPAMLEALAVQLVAAEIDPAVKCVVLTGAGKGFCSGGNMASDTPEGKGFGDMIRDGLASTVNPMLRKLAALKIPVVAAVNGAAAGAGAPLALSADFVIAGESAVCRAAFRGSRVT